MSKSKIFIGIAISFAFGIFISSVMNIPKPAVYVVCALMGCMFGICVFVKNKLSAFGALFLFCAALGVLRLQSTFVENQFQDILDTKQQLEGYIVEDVTVKNNQQTLIFHPNGFSQNIQLTEPLTQKIFYGDWVVVRGKLAAAKNFDTFDYQKYLEKGNIYALMDYPQVLILKGNQLNKIKYQILRVKDTFVRKISKLLPEPQKSLLLGILIGYKGNLPQSTIEEFSQTGASHILAVDGYKVAIVVNMIGFLAYIVGRRHSFWVGLALLSAFVIITGAPASVIRAAIMGALLLMSFNIGRQYSILPSLFFAALIMLIINPRILFWDVGFQLSFAATLGIIYFMPVLENLTEKVPAPKVIKEWVLITLAAVISTMPFILLNFNVLSLSAPIVNILIMPVLGWLMLFGFLSILPFLGPGFAYLSGGLLNYILWATHFFAHLPYASLNFAISNLVFWILVFAVIALYFGLRFLAHQGLEGK